MSIGNFFSDYLNYAWVINIDNFIERYFLDDFVNDCSFNIYFFDN